MLAVRRPPSPSRSRPRRQKVRSRHSMHSRNSRYGHSRKDVQQFLVQGQQQQQQLPGPGIEGDYFDSDNNEELLIQKLHTLRSLIVPPLLPRYRSESTLDDDPESFLNGLDDVIGILSPWEGGIGDGNDDGVNNSNTNSNSNSSSNNENNGYKYNGDAIHDRDDRDKENKKDNNNNNNNRGQTSNSSGDKKGIGKNGKSGKSARRNSSVFQEKNKGEEEKEEIEAMDVTEVMKVIREESERSKDLLKYKHGLKNTNTNTHTNTIASPSSSPPSSKVNHKLMFLQSSPSSSSSSSLRPRTSPPGSSSSPLSVCKFDEDANTNTNHQDLDQGPDPIYTTTTTTNTTKLFHGDSTNFDTTTNTNTNTNTHANTNHNHINHEIFIKKINSVSTSTVTMSLESDDQEKISADSPTNQTTATSKTVKRGSSSGRKDKVKDDAADATYVVPAPLPNPYGQDEEEDMVEEQEREMEYKEMTAGQNIQIHRDGQDNNNNEQERLQVVTTTAATTTTNTKNAGAGAGASASAAANTMSPLKNRLQDLLKKKGDTVALKQKKQAERVQVSFPWGRITSKGRIISDFPDSADSADSASALDAANANAYAYANTFTTSTSTIHNSDSLVPRLQFSPSSPPPLSLPLPSLRSPPSLRRKQQQEEDKHDKYNEYDGESQQDVVIVNRPQSFEKLATEPQSQSQQQSQSQHLQQQPPQEYRTFLLRRSSSFSSSIHDVDEDEGVDHLDQGHEQQQHDVGFEFHIPLHETFQLKRSSSFSSSIHDLDEHQDDNYNHERDDVYLNNLLGPKKVDGEGGGKHEENNDRDNKKFVDLHEIDTQENYFNLCNNKKASPPRHHQGRRKRTMTKSTKKKARKTTTNHNKYDIMQKQEMFIQLQNDTDLQDFKRINNFTFEGDYLLSKILRERSRIQMKKDMLQDEDIDFYINVQKKSKPDSIHEERKVLFFC